MLMSGMVFSGTWAYVAGGSSGFLVLDMANPESPRLVSSLSTVAACNSVAVSGDYAYVTAGPWLLTIDIADPEYPQAVGGVSILGSSGVNILGAYAYISNSEHGLGVYGISTPGSPRRVGSASTPGRILEAAVPDSCVCIADMYEFITMPLQCGAPVPVATISDLRAEPREDGTAITWHGGFDPQLLAVSIHRRTAEGHWSCLMNAPPPENGPDFEFVDEETEPGVAYKDELELVATGGTRRRFGPATCQLPRLPAFEVAVRPMLTRGEFALCVGLARPTDVRIALHDLAGRQLALLSQGMLPAGRHRLEMDLGRAVGASAPAGLYFVRLETPRGWMSCRIARVR